MPDEIPSGMDSRPGLKIRDLPAFFASLPRLSQEEADSFAADIERARAEVEATGVRDPWED